MPKLTTKIEREPLFDDEDPLVVALPGGLGEYRLSDIPVNPPLESDVSPDREPMTYVVVALSSMAWEDPETPAGKFPMRDEMAKKLADALQDNTVALAQLGDLYQQIQRTYGEAMRDHTAAAAGRPTQRRRR